MEQEEIATAGDGMATMHPTNNCQEADPKRMSHFAVDGW
jgi:hypothetical protein